MGKWRPPNKVHGGCLRKVNAFDVRCSKRESHDGMTLILIMHLLYYESTTLFDINNTDMI